MGAWRGIIDASVSVQTLGAAATQRPALDKDKAARHWQWLLVHTAS